MTAAASARIDYQRRLADLRPPGAPVARVERDAGERRVRPADLADHDPAPLRVRAGEEMLCRRYGRLPGRVPEIVGDGALERPIFRLTRPEQDRLTPAP